MYYTIPAAVLYRAQVEAPRPAARLATRHRSNFNFNSCASFLGALKRAGHARKRNLHLHEKNRIQSTRAVAHQPTRPTPPTSLAFMFTTPRYVNFSSINGARTAETYEKKTGTGAAGRRPRPPTRDMVQDCNDTNAVEDEKRCRHETTTEGQKERKKDFSLSFFQEYYSQELYRTSTRAWDSPRATRCTLWSPGMGAGCAPPRPAHRGRPAPPGADSGSGAPPPPLTAQ